MRVTTAFKRLLDLDGVNVVAVDIRSGEVVVDVRLTSRRRLAARRLVSRTQRRLNAPVAVDAEADRWCVDRERPSGGSGLRSWRW